VSYSFSTSSSKANIRSKSQERIYNMLCEGKNLIGKHASSRHISSRVQGKLKLCFQQLYILSNSFENSDFANEVNRYKQFHQDIWRRVNYENVCQCSVKKKRRVLKFSSQNPEILDIKHFFQHLVSLRNVIPSPK
jgi:hypothetical protein